MEHKTISSPYTFRVPGESAGSRIDHYLGTVLPGYSRSFLQKLIGDSYVYCNDKKVSKNSRVKLHDRITVIFPTQKRNKSLYSDYNFGVKVLFEHEHFFIIQKPAGLVTHAPSVNSTGPTLVDWISTYMPIDTAVGSPDRPGIVHRLDKDTSGIMIIARTVYAHMQFTDMFKKRSIQKTYHAYVSGHPNAQGVIELPIGRHPVYRTKMATYTSEKLSSKQVRSATTYYTVLTYFQNHALVELKPTTGRTHQIRVHSAAIGHPLIGDHLYGSKSSFIDRHALHASRLSFTFDNVEYEFSSDMPEDLNLLGAHLLPMK